MDDLVRWFNSWPCPSAPFDIGPALKVVDDALFLSEMRGHIDRCGSKREEIPALRMRLKSLKSWMEKEAH